MNFRAVRALISVIVVPAIARAEVRYKITDLGDLGQNLQHYADPFSVNDNGQVAGESFTGNGQRKAFLWSASAGMIDLIPPGNPGTFPTGNAYGINHLSQVVGYVSTDHDQPFRAYVYGGSTLTMIGTLGGPSSIARAINNLGQVVGSSSIPNGAAHAFLWSASTGMQDLGALAGNSWAYAINDHGQVVGDTATPQFVERAFIWSASAGMVPLGTLGGRHSYAYGINNLGEVVGTAYTADSGGNDREHAFLWTQSTGMIDLGTLGGASSEAYCVNESGWVVGEANLPGNTTVHAFVWDGIAMTDLNDLIDPSAGIVLKYARGINDTGQIVATGVNAMGARAILLTPIPEPGGALLAVCSLVTLRRRRSCTPALRR